VCVACNNYEQGFFVKKLGAGTHRLNFSSTFSKNIFHIFSDEIFDLFNDQSTRSSD